MYRNECQIRDRMNEIFQNYKFYPDFVREDTDDIKKNLIYADVKNIWRIFSENCGVHSFVRMNNRNADRYKLIDLCGMSRYYTVHTIMIDGFSEILLQVEFDWFNDIEMIWIWLSDCMSDYVDGWLNS